MKKRTFLFVLACLMLALLPLHGEEVESIQTSTPGLFKSPIGIGFVPPFQFPPHNGDVIGLRLNIFGGIQNNVGYLDISTIAGVAKGDLAGLSYSTFWNQADCNLYGLQLCGIGNYVRGKTYGIQIAGIANIAGYGNGIQIAAYNQTGDMAGLQIGVVNVARQLKGLQVGLINYIEEGMVPVMIGLNIGF